jgi:hypothetical protein
MPDSKKKLADRAIASARTALEQGKPAEAKKWAQQASQLAPEKEDAWLMLAYLAEPPEGFQLIQQALQSHPDSQRARKAIHYLIKKNQNLNSNRTGSQPIEAPTVANDQAEVVSAIESEETPQSKPMVAAEENEKAPTLMAVSPINHEPIPPSMPTVMAEEIEKAPSLIEEKANPVRADTSTLPAAEGVKEADILPMEKTEEIQAMDELEKIEEIQPRDDQAEIKETIAPIPKKESGIKRDIKKEYIPNREIDPVIILLFLLGVIVTAITILVVLKANHPTAF